MQLLLPEVRKLLDVTQAQTLGFLSHHLPELGGQTWWKDCVLDKLTISQQRMVSELNIVALDQLDLAALLKVLARNWRELAVQAPLRRGGQTLVHELGDIRNQLAHSPAAGLELEELQRAADTVARYLQLLGASQDDIASAESLRDRLRRFVLGGAAPAETAESEADCNDEPGEPDVIPDDSAAPPTTSPEGDDKVAEGVPLPWLQSGAQLTDEARDALASATYVGIDFGTSTSVVSVVETDDETGALCAKPIPIRQFDRAGREIDDHLIPTCIAWVDGKLLVGSGAAALKTELTEGKDVWSSFKMLLGVDLGPQYPSTGLPEGAGPATIERPADAARVFFSALRAGVEDYAKSAGKPERIRYTVTVPASFEANQRSDLVRSIRDAGIPEADCVLFDEPNAAFLSYLIGMEQKTDGTRFVDGLGGKPRKVLVFDFGAGTCDISILEVRVDKDRLTSGNISISRFWALGGDDIDRAIARNVLLPQLCGADSPNDVFTSRELDSVILPRLKPVAEELKVACSKYAEDKGLEDIESLRKDRTPRYAAAVASISLRGKSWTLTQPHMSLAEFASTMEPFLTGESNRDEVSMQSQGVLEPVASALEKAALAPEDLDMVLFIGGSSENPIVRQAIARHVGRFVDCVTPRDMRSHVSQGAAVNSFFFHGLGYTPIRPITSEDILVITRDGGQELVLRAGSSVPSSDINVTEFVVDRDDQDLIELPFCVSNRSKLLGVVTLEPSAPGPFKNGCKIRISCKITADKLLDIRVNAGGRVSRSLIMNPLANRALSSTDKTMFQAEQALNIAILKGRGRPSAAAAITYARSAMNAGQWRKAAEMFEAAEQLKPDNDHAASIDYCYANAREWNRSEKWSRIAYQRSATALTAYNYALSNDRNGNQTQFERTMEESLRHDPSYTPALCAFGHHLVDKSDSRGIDFVTRAFDLLSRELRMGSLDDGDRARLRRCARTLGETKVLEKLDQLSASTDKPSRQYGEENLVRGISDKNRVGEK